MRFFFGNDRFFPSNHSSVESLNDIQVPLSPILCNELLANCVEHLAHVARFFLHCVKSLLQELLMSSNE